MTHEERQLLLKDLSARLPYGVQVSINDKIITTLKNLRVTHFYNDTNTVQDTFVQVDISGWNDFVDIVSIKPYLRPMSSMTEEELKELSNYENSAQRTDFFYSHHIDCRFMIEKGLALEAPEDMYKEE